MMSNTPQPEPLRDALEQLIDGRDLEAALMRQCMMAIMSGHAASEQIAAFLIALRIKGEQPHEIAEAAAVMRELANGLVIDTDGLTDIVGTGGDGASLFNVSTASAFVAAAAGVRIAKHGNRAVSSRSGAADLLEVAGCRLDLSAAEASALINELGIAFLFAPMHHPAMKHAIGPRQALGVRTVFNLLGPLTNPALAPNQVLGVFSASLVAPMAHVMHQLGCRHVMVVHGAGGLDEISLSGPTQVAELRDGQIHHYELEPEALGVTTQSLDTLIAATPIDSLFLVKQALNGEPGPAADMVALNAGAAIYVSGLAGSHADGVARAREAMAKQTPMQRFQAYIERSHAP